MNSILSIFQRKKVIFNKLTAYGFSKNGDTYIYKSTLKDSGFEMTVVVDRDGEVTAIVIDPEFNEPYTLHLMDGAVGSFVGAVRSEYEKILSDISDHCFEPEVFKSAQAKELIEYVRTTYADELEYLWEKFPDNAVWRRKDTTKWYGAMLTVSKRKLGIKSDEVVEIIDLRIAPENIEVLIDGKFYFPGWHMNKKTGTPSFWTIRFLSKNCTAGSTRVIYWQLSEFRVVWNMIKRMKSKWAGRYNGIWRRYKAEEHGENTERRHSQIQLEKMDWCDDQHNRNSVHLD